MEILSIKGVSELERRQVAEILKESRCAHESLTNTFERYRGMLGEYIFFDSDCLSDFEAVKIKWKT